MATYPHPLGESTLSKHWGIGLVPEDPRAHIVSQWPGRNLMGQMLEALRHRLRLQDLQYFGLEVPVSSPLYRTTEPSVVAPPPLPPVCQTTEPAAVARPPGFEDAILMPPSQFRVSPRRVFFREPLEVRIP